MEPSPWGNVFLGQLTDHKTETARAGFNPRPPGVLQAGSATRAVLAFLRERPGVYFSCNQLLLAVARSPKSVDWALRMLRSLDCVEVRRDESRNPRYFRYCFKAQPVDEGDQP